MPLTTDQLEEIVAELVTRPGHEKVRALVCKLLTDGLGAKSRDITFEHHTFEVRGRMDALLGRTVMEMKSDLRQEAFEPQLAGYLKDRRAKTGQDFVGIAQRRTPPSPFMGWRAILAPRWRRSPVLFGICS